MSGPLAGRLVRKSAWDETELVEGTEALLWAADNEEMASVEELPGPATAVQAVLSWVRPKVLRFETVSPEPLPELLLVSTLAVAGPVQFVSRKSYQVGNTAACDPPRAVYLIERRDLYRVPVATRVVVGSPSGRLTLYSMDCSLGGLRICHPRPLEVGAEVDLEVELDPSTIVAIPAIVRHCRPIGPDGRAATAFTSGERSGCPSFAGLQFAQVTADVERQLSQFLGRHQRRLMPRVHAVVPIEYRSHGHSRFVEGVARELSPGDIVLVVYERHVPGDRLELKLHLRRQDFSFQGCAITCSTTGEEEGPPLRHVVRASINEAGDAVEAQFRKAVRDLAIERVGSRRS
jgi:hypothetical protein